MDKCLPVLAAILIMCITVPAGLAAPGYSVVYNFTAQTDDGAVPWSDLIWKDGELYGMTFAGGRNSLGTIFSLRPDGSDYTIIHNFSPQIEDGIMPYGGLVSEGNTIYGMTSMDILNSAGVVFSLNVSGTDFSLLHRFAWQTDNGAMPWGELVSDGSSLYGMTQQGGSGSSGTIFALSKTGGGINIIHSFFGGAGDGATPFGGLIREEDRLYGMTVGGGQTDGGVIFSIGTGGGFNLIHDFTGPPGDGMGPLGNILLADGTIFGMTNTGGVYDEGTVFSLQSSGSNFTILHSFGEQTGGAEGPWGSLILKDDFLYGMTTAGGQTDAGVIFSLRTDGSEYMNLHEFTGLDGAAPYGSLIREGNRLYGMTSEGGTSDSGVVFSYQLPPPPWITDYNGDGVSDIAIFRESSGLWAVRGVTRVYFGRADDDPVPGDYNGDRITDIGIFRESSGLWAVRGMTRAYFGGASDIPVPGDYDGDGACDIGIFRASSGLWAVRTLTRAYFGGSGDLPVPGYYGGSAEKNIGVFRPASGLWAIRSVTRVYFGGSADEPIPGDYDGQGRWTAGVFRTSSGLWAVRGSTRIYFGGSSDDPVPGDYRGNAVDDIGIFRGSSGLWAVRGVTRVYYGTLNDIPVTR